MSIFDGVAAIIDRHLGVQGIGRPPHHKHMSAMLRLGKRGAPSFDGQVLFTEIVEQLEKSLAVAPRFRAKGPSTQNWRFEKKLSIAAHNPSAEKNIEKAAARLLGADWVNQVPTASGLWDSSADKARNIDLVERQGDGAYRLIELKIKSDNALFAAMEILGYGALYVLSRRHYSPGALASKELLRAKSVELCVLAPPEFYSRVNLGWLERALSVGVSDYCRGQVDLGFEMSFAFHSFPRGFGWPRTDQEIEAGFAGRGPAYR